jgi:hypothetical protein
MKICILIYTKKETKLFRLVFPLELGKMRPCGCTAIQKAKMKIKNNWKKRAFWGVSLIVSVPTSILLALYVWLFTCSMWHHPTWEHFKILLFIWQTQIGAAFAVAAALLGASVIYHQTKTTERIEKVRRDRRALALRSVLPLALTELSDYAENCAQINSRLLALSGPIIHLNLNYPEVPSGLVDLLTELIEAIDRDHAKPLSILINKIQVQHAKARGTARRAARNGVVPQRLIDGVIDAAEIHARCKKLFDYARSDADKPATPITPRNVKEALLLMDTGFSNIGEIEVMIDRKVSLPGTAWPES